MYYFTRDWFSVNIPKWQQWLGSYKNIPCKMLEIGCFQGRSTIWSLENILTHPLSRIYCCDTFEGGDDHNFDDTFNMYDIFKNNIKKYQEKVTILKGTSSEQLKLNNFSQIHKESFDIIYIDGDHKSASVLEDAIIAFPLLKPGGHLIFDDYTWGKIESIDACHIGINCFLTCYRPFFDFVGMGNQVCIRKRHNKLILKE